jgi:hypothetical protein
MVEGVNSSMIHLIHCKNFCKCHSVPLPSTTIFLKKRKKEKKTSKPVALTVGIRTRSIT